MHVPLVAEAVRAAAARNAVHIHAQAVLADHIHLLVSLNPATPLTSFIRHAKSESARRLNLAAGRNWFRWCRGYYAGSVSRSHVYRVRVYIGSQQARHPHLVPRPVTGVGGANPGATPRG